MTYTLQYTAYAKEQGREPDAQLAADVIEWPGGRMTGFILWSRERVQEFGALHPDAGFFVKGRLTAEGRSAMDVWLVERGA
jgi:hypothetical protein